jgi:hypothetical protein
MEKSLAAIEMMLFCIILIITLGIAGIIIVLYQLGCMVESLLKIIKEDVNDLIDIFHED